MILTKNRELGGLIPLATNEANGLMSKYNYIQMVFEEVENFQRKDGKILEIGVGTGNLAGKFLQNKPRQAETGLSPPFPILFRHP